MGTYSIAIYKWKIDVVFALVLTFTSAILVAMLCDILFFFSVSYTVLHSVQFSSGYYNINIISKYRSGYSPTRFTADYEVLFSEATCPLEAVPENRLKYVQEFSIILLALFGVQCQQT